MRLGVHEETICPPPAGVRPAEVEEVAAERPPTGRGQSASLSSLCAMKPAPRSPSLRAPLRWPAGLEQNCLMSDSQMPTPGASAVSVAAAAQIVSGLRQNEDVSVQSVLRRDLLLR